MFTPVKSITFYSTGPEGNHGEDCKENYYYLDSSPTHSYMKALYKYPQSEYPYGKLLQEATDRTVHDLEFELEDSGMYLGRRGEGGYSRYCLGKIACSSK